MQMFGFDGSAGGMSVAVHVKSAIFFPSELRCSQALDWP